MAKPTRIYILRNVEDYSGSAPANKELLGWNSSGSYWEPKPLSDFSIDELGDVSLGTPNDGYVLVYDSGDWTAISTESLLTLYGFLDALGDVNAGAPTNRSLLRYDISSGSWIPQPVHHILRLAEIINVNITSPTDKQVLRYNTSSGSWVNASVNFDDLANVNASAPNDGDGIYWNETASKWESGAPPTSGSDLPPLLHVFNEEITSSGSNHQTAYGFMNNSLQVTWNGVRQSPDYFTEMSGSGFTTTFLSTGTDELLVDYVRLSSGSLGVSDSNAAYLVGRKVSAESPDNGDVLTWNGSSGQWEPDEPVAGTSGSDATKLQGRPISTAAPDDGDSLVWNDSAKQWEPDYVTGSGSGIDAEKIQGRDVANTAPSDGQALVWNAGQSQWEPQDQSGSSGGGVPADFTIWCPDAPPPTSGSINDEFDDESFDTSLWSTFDVPSTLSKYENHLGLQLASSTANKVQGIYQEVPFGQNWTIITKVSMSSQAIGTLFAGILLIEDVDNLSTTDLNLFCMYRASGWTLGTAMRYYTDYQTWNDNSWQSGDNFFSGPWYLRLRVYIGRLYGDISLDGFGWYNYGFRYVDFFPTGFGLARDCSVAGVKPVFSFFRFIEDTDEYAYMEGDRVKMWRA